MSLHTMTEHTTAQQDGDNFYLLVICLFNLYFGLNIFYICILNGNEDSFIHPILKLEFFYQINHP